MSIDRAALERAIADARAFNFCAWRDSHALVLTAAQAHLDTLPAKKWGVNSGYGWVHFDSLPLAIDALRVEVMAGRAVTIEYRVLA